MNQLSNRKNFIFGVSSSALQIEGDDGSKGRGKSIWDIFCEKKGVILNDANTDIAIDHYNRYKEDVKLISGLGVDSYRFSLSWPRVLPEGIGKVNQQGVDFYDRLIDELLRNGVNPLLTMYHWDLPYELQKKGGFFSLDFPKWFAEYAEIVSKKFSDRVDEFITFNEPINIINSSYYSGVYPPNLKLGVNDTLKCIHNMCLGHGLAADIFHGANVNAQVGIAMSTFETYPADNNPLTISKARDMFFARKEIAESVENYCDPIYLGKYSDKVLNDYPDFSDYVQKTGVNHLTGKSNFLGFNVYSGNPVNKYGDSVEYPLNMEYSSMGSALDVNGLYWGAKYLSERYKVPLLITESGMANEDVLSADGTVNDYKRANYIKNNLKAVKKLVDEGYDLNGYFVWTMFDNFEWLFGYTKRFGLVYIDYNNNLKRIPKQSYFAYKEYIRYYRKIYNKT